MLCDLYSVLRTATDSRKTRNIHRDPSPYYITPQLYDFCTQFSANFAVKKIRIFKLRLRNNIHRYAIIN